MPRSGQGVDLVAKKRKPLSDKDVEKMLIRRRRAMKDIERTEGGFVSEEARKERKRGLF